MEEFIMNTNQAEYTFKIFKNKKIINGTAIQSVFNGSRIEKCLFENVIMTKCDFEGMNVYETNFINCNFSHSDLKSNTFVNCNFFNCNMSYDLFKNNYFKNCEFNDTPFQESASMYNTYESCVIFNCNLKDSSFSFNNMTHTTFKNMYLGNCSFYRQYMKETVFINSSMNIDALGQLYTISLQNIMSLDYIFLSREYGKMNNELLNKLEEIFKSKKWFFHCLVLERNFGKYDNYQFVVNVANLWDSQLSKNEYINNEDIEFFEFIIDNLYKEDKLPYFALLFCNDTLIKWCRELDYYSYNNVIEGLKKLINNIQIKITYMTNYFLDNAYYSNRDNVLLEIHYSTINNLSVDFPEILNCISLMFGDTCISKKTKTKSGSIIDYIVTSVIAVFGLQFFLYGLNGMLIQVVQLKANIKILSNKDTPRYYLQKSKKGETIKPEMYNKMLSLLSMPDFVNKLKNIQNILKDADIISLKEMENENDKDN